MTFNFNKNWRTTTALCVVSTIAVATTAYAANNGGLSNWDKRLHLNRFIKLFAEIENNKGSNKDDIEQGQQSEIDKWKLCVPISRSQSDLPSKVIPARINGHHARRHAGAAQPIYRKVTLTLFDDE